MSGSLYPAPEQRRWMLYSYDALGLGHVRRTLAIARAVLAKRDDLTALLVTCSPRIDSLPIPPGLDYIKLPSARKLDNTTYVPRSLKMDAESFCRLRSNLLAEVARTYRPDLLLVDKSPLGLMGELSGTLEALRERWPDTRLVLGWRDILDEPGRVRAEVLRNGSLEALEHYYQEIWVYGDPAVFDVRKAYALPDHLAERVRFTGYLAPPVDPVGRDRARTAMSPDGAPVALVSAGGGEDGEALLNCYLEAVRRGLLPEGLRSFVVTGPFMAEAVQRKVRAMATDRVTVTAFLPGLEDAVAAADVVVGMAGYNMVCEILGAGTPAALVPRIANRLEQQLRARHLADRGLAEYVEPGSLAASHLAEATTRALRRGRRPCSVIRTDGLEQVAVQMHHLLPPWQELDPMEHRADVS